MKKLLLCAGVLAIMASCAKYDVDTVSPEAKSNGIVFEATDANATRGGFQTNESGVYEPFWYAEKDNISVYADYATKGADATDISSFGTEATYKATKSAIYGQFTAINNDNILNFKTDKRDADKQPKPMSNFFAVYPAGITTVKGSTFTIALPNGLNKQTQTDEYGAGINDNLVKWSNTSAYPTASYDAVGEKVQLNFNRELNVLRFTTANLKEEYDFGNLKSIVVTAEGYTKEGDAQATIPASKLIYKDGTTLEIELKQNQDLTYDVKSNSGIDTEDGESKITLNVDLPWDDDSKAYMLVADVDRKAAKFTTEKPETVSVVYNFENIEFETSFTTPNNWGPNADGIRGMYPVKALDINDYPYLVVRTTSSDDSDLHLIVNKYSEDMFDETEDGELAVVWPYDTDEPIEVSKFAKVTSNAAWGEDLAYLADFTALTYLDLEEDTELPAAMLAAGTATALETLVAPKVTKVSDKLFAVATATTPQPQFSGLETLKLGSYKFEDSNDVNNMFFAKEANTLTHLDISAVETLQLIHMKREALVFTNFVELVDVKVHDGLEITNSAFSGCVNLEKVDGTVDVTNAQSGFYACAKLKTINITGTEIPNSVFRNCSKLENVLVGGKQVVPTSIGEHAFHNTAIKTMDLKDATVIGTSAFEGCSNYVGVSATGETVVKVAVVEPYIFKGTKLYGVTFTDAETLKPGAFSNVTSLVFVKFYKDFTAVAAVAATATDPWATTFGTASENISLTVASSKYVDGNTLVLPYTSGSGNSATTKESAPIKFKGIAIVK